MFLRNYPAMVVKENLIVSDLHLGITKELYESGIMMPQQSSRLSERLNKIKSMTKTRRLVILGDVKHEIPVISIQEKKEIHKFFERLNFNKVIITKGNHDGRIEELIANVKKDIKIKNSFAVGGYAFTHGHIKIKTKKKKIVIGHNHPKIMFKDAMNATYFEQVCIKGEAVYDGKKREIIIMPPFNELAGSLVVNDMKRSDKEHKHFMGPIARHMTNINVYLLDGTDLGNLMSLTVRRE